MNRIAAAFVRKSVSAVSVAIAVAFCFGGISGCVTLDLNSAQKLAQLASLGSESAVSVRKTPENPLAEPLNLIGWGGPEPTERTIQLLRRLDLEDAYDVDSDATIRDLHQRHQEEPSLEKLHALAELSYVQATRARGKRRFEDAANLYGATLVYAYEYLFDRRFEAFRNDFDPEFRSACDLYNGGLEGLLRLLRNDERLLPGSTGMLTTVGNEIEFTITLNGPWHYEDFAEIEFASDYQVNGLNNTYSTYGLGVPLIAVRGSHPHESPHEQYYPNGLSFAVSAFFRKIPNANPRSGKVQGVIELHDPLRRSHINLDGERVPLESDITTPLAYYLNDPLVSTNTIATLSLLNADFGKNFRGLYMLEPYDPNRIPVVMVHGLWSSPVTWMEMFNDLRALPEIRDNYQFWFYMYPTGQPFWVSANQMREDLAEAHRNLDPYRQSELLHEMVLVGHSMGGLVSRMQTIYSEDDFWRIMTDQAFNDLSATEETKQQLADIWFFEPNPSIRRVITIGTPHRGSEFANSTTRWLSHKFFTLPQFLARASKRVIRENPGYFHNTDLLTINTSVDSLAPDSPILPAILNAEMGPRITHHNIVGHEAEENFLAKLGLPAPPEGDGVVSLVSATVENATSHIEVTAGHTAVHQHPRAILEVRRILLEHLARVRGDRTWDPAIRPVDYQTRVANGPAEEEYSSIGSDGRPIGFTPEPAQSIDSRPVENPLFETDQGNIPESNRSVPNMEIETTDAPRSESPLGQFALPIHSAPRLTTPIPSSAETNSRNERIPTVAPTRIPSAAPAQLPSAVPARIPSAVPAQMPSSSRRLTDR